LYKNPLVELGFGKIPLKSHLNANTGVVLWVRWRPPIFAYQGRRRICSFAVSDEVYYATSEREIYSGLTALAKNPN
jgi:hypothetical protein